MAENIVEHVGFLQIIQLIGSPDEIARDKAAVGKMIEKNLIRHKPRHRHDLPAGCRHQSFVEFGIIGNARLGELENLDTFQERACRPSRKHRRLARKQPIPHIMFGLGKARPILRDCPIRCCTRWRAIKDIVSHVPQLPV